jgi:hypothetical protein
MQYLLSVQAGEHLALIILARIALSGAALGLRTWMDLVGPAQPYWTRLLLAVLQR